MYNMHKKRNMHKRNKRHKTHIKRNKCRRYNMGHVITFLNEKGGVGKSAICFNVGWYLSELKKKVLFIDLDGQRANLTYFCGIHNSKGIRSLYDVLTGTADVNSIIKQINTGLDIIPAIDDIVNLTPENAPLKKMMKLIDEVRGEYDFVLIDVNPTPGRSHALALCVADFIIVPMLADVTSLMANMGIIESINIVSEKVNPKLKVMGFVFNRWNWRTNLSKQAMATVEEMVRKVDSKIFKTKIRNNIALSENVAEHIGVTNFAPRSKGAEDIMSLTKEILKEVKKHG